VRVIGGRWRGRRLKPAPGGVRPTTDRVREALFNLLAAEIAGAAVADLCCGSGALGLEALSRGAARADFVDTAPASLAAAKANLELCGAEPATWRLHRADAARWLDRRLRRADPPLVVLADPPYGGAAMADLLDLLRSAPTAGILVLVLEHPADEAPPAVDPARWTAETRRYGGSALTLLRPAEAGEPEARHG
jgi:16S rRNA (guanine966-N2)-methyltransferase